MHKQHNHKKPNSPIRLWLRQIRTFVKRAVRGLKRSLVGNWATRNKGHRQPVAGFLLPTVAMVLMVVVLLSMAILFRSMERAKYAQYSKVDEATLQAATPAIQRARAKISALETDNSLPTRGTPSELALYEALSRGDAYRLPDEVPIQVRYDLNDDGTIDDDDGTPLYDRESITTAWKFPIDTDNNGIFDTWTLYGIYLRSPAQNADGAASRARSPLDARTPPRTSTQALGNQCAALGVGNLVGDLGWYSAGSQLKKSVFTYVANVPITQDDLDNLNSQYTTVGEFETRPGNTGFSALEYQQDLTRIPINNNAIVYRDDLAMAPGGGLAFQVNGRVTTNSNLILTQFSGLDFYLVSSPSSCHYEPENSKILVGGNVVSGGIGGNANGNSVKVHRFDGQGNAPKTGAAITTSTDSTSNKTLEALDNAAAFEARLDDLVEDALATDLSNDIDDAVQRENAIRTYFEDRTRRVPYAEVALGNDAGNAALQGSADNDNLRPQETWIFPTKVGDNRMDTGNSPVSNIKLDRNQPPADNPANVDDYQEPQLGNRVLVGNALPAVWYDEGGEAVASGTTQELDGFTWTDDDTPRTRQSRIQALPDVGATDRDGFWERAAGIEPVTAFDNLGGLRVVTSAGVYDRTLSFLPPPKLDVDDEDADGNPLPNAEVIAGTYDDPDTATTETYTIVWPDTMPMSPPDTGKVFDNEDLYDPDTQVAEQSPSTEAGAGSRWEDLLTTSPLPTGNEKYSRGDLRMRATAVYHYADSNFSKEDGLDNPDWSQVTQQPLACVSSYYDPSTSLTAKNESGLAWNSMAGGKSNNGIVYGPPNSTSTNISQLSAPGDDGLLSGTGVAGQLAAQANMVFPNGRFANPILRAALQRPHSERTLSEQSSIDSTLCALGILGDGVTLGTAPGLPDGAIYETSFLDAREIKQIEEDAEPTGQSYDMPLEFRQPLEIRSTVLDIDKLRSNTIAQTTDGPNVDGNEFYLPLSGIIFASRDDALMDVSGENAFESATDFELDPTRRPNGIMLVNGKCLQRDTGGSCQPTGDVTVDSIIQEKGLTLVSNLPVYVKGDFNLHTQEEFTETLTANWSNFYTRATRNGNFACRKGDPRLDCNTGDDWRVANINSDSVTVLSGDVDRQTDEGFRFGYRDEGDFDLNNNAGITQIGYDLDGDGDIGTDTVAESVFDIDLNGNGNKSDTAVAEWEVTTSAARTVNGFYDNHFALNGLSSGITFDTNDDGDITAADTTYNDASYVGTAGINSSYFNNFVTPVQRRSANSRDFMLETCRKLPLSACGPTDWVMGYNVDGDYIDVNGNGSYDRFIDQMNFSSRYPGDEERLEEIDEDGNTVGKKEADLTLADILLLSSEDMDDDSWYIGDITGNDRGNQQCENLLTTTTPNPSASDLERFCPNRFMAGSGAFWTQPEYHRFPRRLAFLRNLDDHTLVLDSGDEPPTIGVADPGAGCGNDIFNGSLGCFSANGFPGDEVDIGDDLTVSCKQLGSDSGGQAWRPRCLNSNQVDTRSPWYRTNKNGNINYGTDFPLWYAKPGNAQEIASLSPTVQNPLLVPVLQLDATTTTAGADQGSATGGSNADDGTSWIADAAGDTTFNFVVATGDLPSRPEPGATTTKGEFNGGLPNLVRLLENWQDKTVTIFGSFIQSKRSNYATSPYTPTLQSEGPVKAFGGNIYKTSSTGGRTPYFSQPGRNWGFDVGLLSQSPDLFTSRLTNPNSDNQPDEFFRRVSRTDDWIQALLCAKETSTTEDPDTGEPIATNNNAVGGSDRPDDFCDTRTGG